MSLKSKLRAGVLSALLGERARAARRLSSEWKRRIAGKAHEVSVFLQLDDPYSYLLSLYLPFVADDFDVVFSVYLSQALGEEYRPEPALLAEYAAADCRLLARELGVPFLDKGDTPVVEHRRALASLLAAEHDSEGFPALLFAVLAGYWRGDTEGVNRILSGHVADADAKELIERNQATLEKLGHYNSAMLHYAGEWYWGVDRLPYLVDRLDALELRRGDRVGGELASIRQAMQLNLPARVPAAAAGLPPLEFFFSFRSPYSYLAMQRTFDIADAYGLELILKPVLPMVARGLPVPGAKLRYIVADAKREADALSVPFGRFCDPLGEGVERLLAVFDYARGERRERDLMLSAGAAIWAEATDVATDAGMRRVAERAGLFWPDVLEAMQNDDWRATVADNREALAEAGLWGVPAFRVGELSMWGQDRLWLMARQIEDRCHDGEGILV